MRRPRLVLASPVATAMAVLTACAPRPREVAGYRGHADARAQTLAACRDEAATPPSAACAKALRADAEAMVRAAWTTEPPRSRLTNPGKFWTEA